MNEVFEREKACYEQNSENLRSLNQIMWKVPMIAMTLTGGVWYAVASLAGMLTSVKYGLLVFVGVADIFLIFILQRVRSVMAAYLAKMKEFHPGGFADTESDRATAWLKERGVANTFCWLLLIAAVMSFMGLFLI